MRTTSTACSSSSISETTRYWPRASRPENGQLPVQWMADASGILDQAADEKLDGRPSHGLGEPSQRPFG